MLAERSAETVECLDAVLFDGLEIEAAGRFGKAAEEERLALASAAAHDAEANAPPRPGRECEEIVPLAHSVEEVVRTFHDVILT